MVDQLSKEAEKKLEQILDHFFSVGGVFKDAHGITDEEMEAIYSIGYNLYQNGKYDDALNVFKFLCFFDHLEKKYWIGLGAVHQMMGNYEKAIEAYSYAAFLDLEDPRPAIHAADCHLILGNKEAAESALNAVIEFCSEDPEKKSYVDRAKTLLGMLKQEQESSDKKSKNSKE